MIKMMQDMGQQPQFAPPVEMQDGQWMGPVAEQMVPLNCPPGIYLSNYLSPISVYPGYRSVLAVYLSILAVYLSILAVNLSILAV